MSDWKKSAADRRDARNSKDPEPQVTAAAKTDKVKKDKKRWCKGKVGVEHILECRDYKSTKNAPDYLRDWKLLVCTTCGKELERWAPMGRWRKQNKPDWVK